jgi:ankyrin repeat protein
MLERALAIEPARLVQAVEGDDLASARMLLGQGADANAWCDTRGKTVLVVAAERGSLAMVRLLVENQANIRRKERSTRMTALAYAVSRGRRNVAAYLLRQGADANAVVRLRGEPECSLWALSLRQKDPAMARLLMAHGARREE